MEAKIGVILASHGDFARGAVTSIDMIMGGGNDLQVVSVEPDMGIDTVENAFERCFEKLSDCTHILICVDILSGTPCNVAARFHLTRENVSVLAGFNLTILMEILSKINSGETDVAGILGEAKDVFSRSLSVFCKQ